LFWPGTNSPAVIDFPSSDDRCQIGDALFACAAIAAHGGFQEITGEEAKKPARASHHNAMQPWKVARDGSVHNAMFA
jgi:hypothetical protein